LSNKIVEQEKDEKDIQAAIRNAYKFT